MVSITIKNLTFSYNSHKILDDLNLVIENREVTSLVGPNGSGKTTLIKCIDRILKPKGGIFLDGQEVTKLQDYPEWNPQGPRDFYARDVEARDYYLGSYILAPGGHMLRFESAGANPFSTGTAIGLDSVRLRARWHTKRKSLRPAAPQ